MELRLNRLARATTTRWFCGSSRHMTSMWPSQDLNSGLSTVKSLRPISPTPLILQMENIWDPKKQKDREEALGSELRSPTSISCVLPPTLNYLSLTTPRCCHENKLFFISGRWCKALVMMARSTNSEIPVTRHSSLRIHISDVRHWASCFTSLRLCPYRQNEDNNYT